jgi:hypothetical protein
VVGEDVRGSSGHEPVGQGGPVVVPAALSNLYLDVRVGLGEIVSALLVGRELVGVPKPVVDFSLGLGGSRCGASTGGKGQRDGCGGSGDANGSLHDGPFVLCLNGERLGVVGCLGMRCEQ